MSEGAHKVVRIHHNMNMTINDCTVEIHESLKEIKIQNKFLFVFRDFFSAYFQSI